eukprot:gene17337-17528_t
MDLLQALSAEAFRVVKEGVQLVQHSQVRTELTYPSTNNSTYADGGIALNAYARAYHDAGLSTNPPTNGYPSVYLQYLTSSSLIPYYSNASLVPASDPNIGYASRCIWMELNNITIKNTSLNITERTINFTYNNNPLKRLALNALNILDKGGSAIQNYAFSYNQTPLPNYLATLTDHWGFNNNVTTPLVVGNNNNFAQVRAPDATGVQTQAEILTGITYPTGGTTNYIYEPNSYYAAINRASGVTPVTQSGIAAEYVTSAVVHTYQWYGVNRIYNDAVFNFESATPVSYSSIVPTTYAGYLNGGNLSSTLDNSGHSNAYIWDYNKSKPSAIVKNASNVYSGTAPVNNIATTSKFSVFLPGTSPSATVIVNLTVARTGPITILFSYNNNTAQSGNNSTNFQYQLTGNGQYQSGGICTALPGGTSSCSSTPTTLTINNVAPGTYALYLQVNYMTADFNYGTGNWTGINVNSILQGSGALTGMHNHILLAIGVKMGHILFPHAVTGSSAVNISGTGSIDELRLYPIGSQMTTYTYEPLVGLKSIADTKQQITNYAYDNFQRL